MSEAKRQELEAEAEVAVGAPIEGAPEGAEGPAVRQRSRTMS